MNISDKIWSDVMASKAILLPSAINMSNTTKAYTIRSELTGYVPPESTFAIHWPNENPVVPSKCEDLSSSRCHPVDQSKRLDGNYKRD